MFYRNPVAHQPLRDGDPTIPQHLTNRFSTLEENIRRKITDSMKDDIKNSIHSGIPAQNYEVDILPRYKEALSLGLSSYKHHLQKTKITASTGSVFKVPFSVIAAWIMGIPMDLDFNLMETGSLFISVLLKAFTLQYVDFRMGEESGFIRFEEPEAAAKARAAAVLLEAGGLVVKNCIASLEPVTGEAEKVYWSLTP